MIVGFNAVIIDALSTGTRQRDLHTVPCLMRMLLDRGDRPVIYTAATLPAPLLDRLVPPEYQTHVVRTPIPTLPTYRRILSGIPYWGRQTRRDRIDIFHTSYYPLQPVSARTVFHVNDVRFLHHPETYKRSRYLFLKAVVGNTIRKADRIIAISEDTKRDLVNFFQKDPDDIDVAYIPASPAFSKVEDEEKLQAVRSRYRLPARFVLFVGHLEPRKNLKNLAEAFIAARQDGLGEWHLVIAGPEDFGVENLWKRLGDQPAAHGISFTGYVPDEDLAALYTLSSALAFPSQHEGFGIPLIEAMACETPILTSNSSALREVAGDAAILIDPFDIGSITAGLGRLMGEESLRRQLVQKGRERLQRFTPEKTAEAILASYDRLFISR